MFQVNDTIIYGNHGVCKVMDVGKLSMNHVDKNRNYYTLSPVYQNGALVYAPVDNDKVVMRHILSKKEAESLVQEIPKIESVWIANEREREAQYKAIIKTCDCRELIKIIKTIYERKMSRIKDGKKATAIDEKYFRLAEEKLYGELAIALNLDREEVVVYITKKIKT